MLSKPRPLIPERPLKSAPNTARNWAQLLTATQIAAASPMRNWVSRLPTSYETFDSREIR